MRFLPPLPISAPAPMPEESYQEEGGTVTGAPSVPEENVMPEDEFLGIVKSKLTDSRDFVDQWLSPDRAKAHEYYLSREFGDEETGRSQYVDSTLRDTVNSILPSLLKIFFSSERVVEFLPKHPEDVPFAEQATEYCRWLFSQKNPGYMILHSAFKDALIKGNAFLKVYHLEVEDVTTHQYTGLDDDTVASLMTDPDIEISAIDSRPIEVVGADVPMEELPMIHDLSIQKRTREGQIKVENLPPEEFLFNRRNKGLNDPTTDFVCHRRIMTLSELQSMGYDTEGLEEYAGDGFYFDTQEEFVSRRPETQSDKESGQIETAGKRVLYHEIYAKIDFNQDGHQEWRRICLIGEEGDHLLMNEPCDGHPFIALTPFPEPHDPLGSLSMWHMLRDIQRVKSSILRSMLDSLSLSVHPRISFVDGEVSVSDLMNNSVGALVRMRTPGSIQPLNVPYVGQAAEGVLRYFDSVREERTGITKAAAGLDPEVLQSATRQAVNNTITQSQEKIGLIARTLAETGIKDLFRTLLKLVVTHQDQPTVLRLRNNWVPMQPQSWDTSMDVQVNVGLGAGDEAFKLSMLQAISAKQEQILQTVGPDNPLVDVGQLYNTYAKMAEIAGYKDPSQFFKDPRLEPPKPPAPPEPSPEELLADVQRQQIQAQMQIEASKLALATDKAHTDAGLKQSELETDAALKMAELKAKYHTSIDTTELRGMLDTQRELVRQQGLLESARINKRSQ